MKSVLSVSLRPALPGLFFALLTILSGFGLGIVFGAAEDAIRAPHKRDAMAVRDTIYRGDDKAIQLVLDRAWNYYRRAHLHAGGIGASAIAMILTLALVSPAAWVTRAAGLLLGLGGLGYSWYWFWAGSRAPGMGSTAAAKESLAWFAMPTSGAVVLGAVIVAVVIGRAWLGKPQPEVT